jgi:hypothetical protein
MKNLPPLGSQCPSQESNMGLPNMSEDHYFHETISLVKNYITLAVSKTLCSSLSVVLCRVVVFFVYLKRNKYQKDFIFIENYINL